MKKEYSIENDIKKFKRLKVMAILLMVIGIIITSMSFISDYDGTFRSIGKMIDDLLIIGIGIYLFIVSDKKLKTLEN